jgi:hypothetical protein
MRPDSCDGASSRRALDDKRATSGKDNEASNNAIGTPVCVASLQRTNRKESFFKMSKARFLLR